MATTAERKKLQKKTDRRKKIVKERNFLSNLGKAQYRLFVLLEKDWRLVKKFRTRESVKKYIDEIEVARKRGDTEIIEGKVLDIGGNIVATILPFTIEKVGPSMAEAAVKQ
jgi:hypothetical protein